ncbi:MAG: META domain-containing protein [Erythrobacter sp.]|nr:META domain-containing protein [Erythrobacter sp.]
MKLKVILAAGLMCWAVPGSAIIEGVEADPSHFPSYASIRAISPYPVHEGRELNACGATLVAPRWVLSALHCKNAFDISGEDPVLVGLNLQEDGTFKVKLRVLEVHFAPAPLDKERVDAVLLKLETDATIYGAQVASLADARPPLGGETVTVGLGQGLEGAGLEYYTSRVADPQLCDSPRADFEPSHDFCVGLPGAVQRTGYGDSGGPLYVPVTGENAGDGAPSYALAGVVKGGVKAGPTGTQETEYIRYTDVAALRDWIARITTTNGASSAMTSPNPPGTPTPDAALTNTYWRIDHLAGQDVRASDNRREPHIVLHSEDANRPDGANRLAATVGCNRISAGFTHDADTLSFGPIASTKRACLPPFDRLEADLMAALERTASYAIAGDTLRLIDADGADLARLEAVYLY